MRKLKKAVCLMLCCSGIFAATSCSTNGLPRLDTSLEVSTYSCPAKVRSHPMNAIWTDERFNELFIGNRLPDVELSEITSLPVYESAEPLYEDLTVYGFTSMDEINEFFAPRPQELEEKYKPAANKIAEYFGGEITNTKVSCSRSGIYADFEINGSSRFTVLESGSWQLTVHTRGMDYSLDPAIEKAEEDFDEDIFEETEDVEELESAMQKIIELYNNPLPEDVEKPMAKIIDDLKEIAPELFPDEYEYKSSGQGERWYHLFPNDPLRLRYTNVDMSEDKSKLLSYNGMVSGCWLTIDDGSVEISYSLKDDPTYMGEYQTITPEEAAKRLKLGEDEKLAILYIYSETGDRTLIRPVYTKYVKQSDFYDRALAGGTYIDALK